MLACLIGLRRPDHTACHLESYKGWRHIDGPEIFDNPLTDHIASPFLHRRRIGNRLLAGAYLRHSFVLMYITRNAHPQHVLRCCGRKDLLEAPTPDDVYPHGLFFQTNFNESLL